MTEMESFLVFLIVAIPAGVLLYATPQLCARFVAPCFFDRFFGFVACYTDKVRAFVDTAKSDEPHAAKSECVTHLMMPAYDSLEFLDALTTIRFYDLPGADGDEWPVPTSNHEAELDQHIATILEEEGLL